MRLSFDFIILCLIGGFFAGIGWTIAARLVSRALDRLGG